MADINRDRQRDAAGVGPYARDAERLVRLKDLGSWDVAEGEPDIRGWEVRTVGGRDLGKVKELLVDPDAGEVVMIDVDLSGTDRHALVPLRIVEIDRPRRVVRMDSADLTPAEQEAASESQETRTEGRERTWSDSGRVRYASRGDDEKVVERRPMVEEVVVRRRIVEDTKDAEATEAEATQGRRDDDRTVSS
jgi:hypothetical protein